MALPPKPAGIESLVIANSGNTGYILPVGNSDGTNAGGSTADGASFTAGTSTGTISEGVYESTPTTVADGKAGAIGIDASRNTKVTQATLIAGEDLTNNLMKTEQRFSYSAVATADVQIKGSAGFLHTVTFSCNDAAPTAGSIIIYDSLTEAGTQVFNHTFTTTPFVPFTIILDYTMLTGIYIGFTTTADVNVSCSYR